MDAALYASSLALGLAGAPHCVAMCAAPCAAATGQGGARSQWLFHLARAAGYAAAGALAAASVNSLGALGAVSPIFKPLWTAVHAAALTLGLWLALTGRQPAWMERIGRQPGPATGSARGGWQVMQGPGRAVVSGALWVAWPCGLLQSAVLVAALADTAWTGAGVMLIFAMATGVGLSMAPWVWRRLGAGRLVLTGSAGVRVAGVCLAAASSWVLLHGLWTRFAAYCGF